MVYDRRAVTIGPRRRSGRELLKIIAECRSSFGPFVAAAVIPHP
jgi:hypothetical protein